ncbi:hypothetical protein [Enterovibrio baiacu]|uniref:hypothetical protein n=1 Tax=Enterovibrio baiacu TaxID=2491023 RepID=UPI001012ECC7|nr:hypothetical protein [Enterovibrio baiacu]MBE1273295.1 hypothetical protein [Enterovibrio baiacu]
MVTLQFLQSEDVVTYIDVNSATYDEELNQLQAQGFKLSGEPIIAKEISDCVSKHKCRHEEKMKEYAALSVVLAIFGIT